MKNTGYPMISRLISKIESEMPEINEDFKYEPGEILKELFESSDPFNNQDSSFKSRTQEKEYSGNKLFSQMRKSLKNLKQK